MTPSGRARAGRWAGKGAFYLRKLAWLAGRTRFDTAVGPMTIPRSVVSPGIFYLLVSGEYETPELALLTAHLRPDDRVIELGSGLGFLANVYGRRCSGEKHLAIEASPAMADLVRANTAQLGNVDVLNAIAAANPAAGADGQPPRVPFYVYEEFWASSMSPLHLQNPSLRLVRTEQVPLVDLDALITRYRATVLVCDIEGGEAALFADCRIDVPTIVLELHWATLGFPRAMALLNALERRGYRLQGTPDVLVALRSKDTTGGA